MDQAPLYKIFDDCGFKVLVFEDHPQFFGNWRAHIKRGNNIYEVVSDNREGWLTLWRQVDGRQVQLFEAESSKLDQDQELALVKQWLDDVKKS